MNPATATFDEILLSQVEMLSNQIKVHEDKTEEASEEGGKGGAMESRFARALRVHQAHVARANMASASSNTGSFF